MAKRFQTSKGAEVNFCGSWKNTYTVKPVYNDHPQDPKFVAVVGKWSLFRGSFMIWKSKMGPQNGGRCRQMVAIRSWSLTQVWLYLNYHVLKQNVLPPNIRFLVKFNKKLSLKDEQNIDKQTLIKIDFYFSLGHSFHS